MAEATEKVRKPSKPSAGFVLLPPVEPLYDASFDPFRVVVKRLLEERGPR